VNVRLPPLHLNSPHSATSPFRKMRLATVAVLIALAVSACMSAEVAPVEVVAVEAAVASAEEVAAAPKEAVVSAKASRAADSGSYSRIAQNRDGAHHHHHHHEHPAPIQTGYASAPAAPVYDAAPAAPAYAQPAPAPVYEAAPAAPSYDAAPAYEPAPAAPAAYAAAPVYEAAAAAPAYEAAPAPAYSTPGHQGYYYYYYPVKDSKAKLKLPKLPKMPSLPHLRLPEYVGKEGGLASYRSIGAVAAAAVAMALGAVFSAPVLGLGAGRRSLSSLWENEYLTRDNLNVLAEFILNSIDSYQGNV